MTSEHMPATFGNDSCCYSILNRSLESDNSTVSLMLFTPTLLNFTSILPLHLTIHIKQHCRLFAPTNSLSYSLIPNIHPFPTHLLHTHTQTHTHTHTNTNTHTHIIIRIHTSFYQATSYPISGKSLSQPPHKPEKWTKSTVCT